MRDETSRPVAPQRSADLVVRSQGDGTLVLDRRSDTVHYLPAETTRVWGACTGSNTLAEIASVAAIDEQTAASAVDQLMALDLLDVRAGIDRRKFLTRSALIGAGALTVSAVESVVAPTPAAAQTIAIGNCVFLYTCNNQASGSANVSVTCTGATPNRPYLVQFVSINPANGPRFTTNPSSVDSNGNYRTGNNTFGANNSFGCGPPTITATVIRSDTGQVVEVLTVSPTSVGPSTPPTVTCGTCQQLAFTPSCSTTTPTQAQWGADLTGWPPDATLTVTATAQLTNGTTLTASVDVTTDANGEVIVPPHDYGSPGDFPNVTSVTITVTDASGNTLATFTVTENPCA